MLKVAPPAVKVPPLLVIPPLKINFDSVVVDVVLKARCS